MLRPALVPYALSVGLTPLIPVPFLDDVVRGRLVHMMLDSLAEEAGVPLGDLAREELAREPSSGCLAGALAGCLAWPFKKVLRKVFFLLEWKRAVDLIARTYVYGDLVAFAMEQGWAMGPEAAGLLREAAWETMDEVGTSPVEHAVAAAVAGARDTLRGAADLVARTLRPKEDPASREPPAPPSAEEVDLALREVRAREREQLRPVAQGLAAQIQRIPEDYFQTLRAGLARRLDDPGLLARTRATPDPAGPDPSAGEVPAGDS